MLTLCVMLKNELTNIDRLLKSCPWIDRVVALDTGSSDGSQQLLRDRGAIVFEEPFINFAQSRTRLLQLAKGVCKPTDWLLLADMDFVFEDNGFIKEKLEAPCYSLMLKSGNLSYSLPRILKADRDWTFACPVHEYIVGTEDAVPLETLSIQHLHDGCRSQGNKFLQDLPILMGAHLADPADARICFYLARTLDDLNAKGCARLYYEQRAAMPNTWAEESWWSQRAAARLSGDVEKMFMAFQARPWRAEPLMDIVRHLQSRGQDASAFESLRRQVPFPPKNDRLFIETDCYARD